MSATAALTLRYLGCWLAILSIATACLGCTRQTVAPRPPSVPADAIWVGGPDGGVFLRLEEGLAVPSMYYARIHADSSGEVIFQGMLKMVPPNHARINVDDPAMFSGWDGENLHLTDGALLKAVRGAAASPR